MQVTELAGANVLSTPQLSSLQAVQIAYHLPGKQGLAVLTVAGDGTLVFKESGSYDRKSKLVGTSRYACLYQFKA